MLQARIPVAVFLALAAGLRGQAPADASKTALAPPPPALIGVVDFARVFEAYPKAIEQGKQLDEHKKRRMAELKAEETKAQDLQVQRDMLQPGFEKDLKEIQLRNAVQFREQLASAFDREMSRKRREFLVGIFDDMQRAVRIVAKERGLHLVIRSHEDLLDGSVESKAIIFEQRVVWYASEEIDNTPAVIKLLQVGLPELPKPAEAKSPAGAKPNGN